MTTESKDAAGVDELILHAHEYPPGVGDFCCFLDIDRWPGITKRLHDSRSVSDLKGDWSLEEEISLRLEAHDRTSKVVQARSLITFSERKTRLCASLRLLNQAKTYISKSEKRKKEQAEKRKAKKSPKKNRPQKVVATGGFLPVKRTELIDSFCIEPDNRYLFWADSVADELLSLLGLVHFQDDASAPNLPMQSECLKSRSSRFEIASHPAGLVVFAGATGTGKTVAATTFVLRLLLRQGLIRQDGHSPPHLVTFEDPIEPWKFFANKEKESYLLTGKYPSDRWADPLRESVRSGKLVALTAREKKHDVLSLQEACMHALRQKPTIVYVGEVRNEADWQFVLQLSSTGHLVVTTCHASTLIDAFLKIAGKRCKTAEERHTIAASLRGVVHLANEKFDWSLLRSHYGESDNSKEESRVSLRDEQTLFQVWRQTNESVTNFVVDGLSSIFSDGDNTLSRVAMSRRILNRQQTLHLNNLDYSILNEITARTALTADLSLT
ncbi:MAG: ATPase, T2SS/T4P/T4SS family [Pirellulales bacterium]